MPAHILNTNISLIISAAERQCCQIKRRLGVSEQFDTAFGADDYAAFHTVVETVKTQDLYLFDALEQVLAETSSVWSSAIGESTLRSVKLIITTKR